jgi:hypothetical protein
VYEGIYKFIWVSILITLVCLVISFAGLFLFLKWFYNDPLNILVSQVGDGAKKLTKEQLQNKKLKQSRRRCCKKLFNKLPEELKQSEVKTLAFKFDVLAGDNSKSSNSTEIKVQLMQEETGENLICQEGGAVGPQVQGKGAPPGRAAGPPPGVKPVERKNSISASPKSLSSS